MKVSLEEKLFFLLRLGVAVCFIGHGAWGIIGKEGWLPFFQVFFLSENMSWTFMPLIGVMDILIGLMAFFIPTKGLLVWATVWTLFTAALRPSAGLGMSEFFERAGNFGVPFAFLWITNSFYSNQKWWTKLNASSIHLSKNLPSFELILKICLASLLMGHGGLALFQDHPVLTKHFHYFGLPSGGIEMKLFGVFEMILGISVLFFSHIKAFLFFIFIYKLGTELVHPLAGNTVDIFETIERAGDYILPLLLIVRYSSHTSSRNSQFQLHNQLT